MPRVERDALMAGAKGGTSISTEPTGMTGGSAAEFIRRQGGGG